MEDEDSGGGGTLPSPNEDWERATWLSRSDSVVEKVFKRAAKASAGLFETPPKQTEYKSQRRGS